MSVNQKGDDVRVDVYVQPRAGRTEIVGLHGDALKIRLAAPPVDGAANEALVRFMSELFRVSASRVNIVSGATGRRKIVELENMAAAHVQAAIDDAMRAKS